MAWFKVDNALPTHRKVLSIPRGARRVSAIGVWALGGAWSSANLTEGFIEGHVLTELGFPSRAVADLVTAGLWVARDGGYQMHDFLTYNPSREHVQRERRTTAERQQKWRDAKRGRDGNSVTNAVTDETVTPLVTGAPTRPDPTQLKELPRRRGTALPEAFAVDDGMRRWATAEVPLVDVDAQTARFRDHHTAKGSVFKDWIAAWRTWMRNAQTYAERDGVRPMQRRPLPAGLEWMAGT